jgi:hypothetical protein
MGIEPAPIQGAGMEKFDLRIKDVVEATGLKYDYIRRALIDGSLEGLVAARLLRTNKRCVEEWQATLRNAPPPPPPSSTDTATPAPERLQQVATKAYKHVDPSTFGKRGK